MEEHAVLPSQELASNLIQDQLPPPSRKQPMISEWTEDGNMGSPLTQEEGLDVTKRSEKEKIFLGFRRPY
jgi:hypothetical protein